MNTANKLTVLRMALVPVMLVFLWLGGPLYEGAAAAIFLIASLTDMLDGQIARRFNQITDFGKFADPIADKLLVISAMVQLIQMGRIQAWIVVVFIAREFIVSGVRMVAAGQGNVMAAGMMGKIKTVLQMVAVTLIILREVLPPFFGLVGEIALWGALLTTVIACVQYVYAARGSLQQMK